MPNTSGRLLRMQIDLFKDVLVPVVGGLGLFMLGLELMSMAFRSSPPYSR
jgi:hypothetical protein